jgi:phytoene dehydrogenase-like protein
VSEKITIIGAGMAGLSAGCYLQDNGYSTEILEAHTLPGGLCTSWERKGYLIEGCIHGLLGSEPSHPFYKLWNEMIDMEQIQFYDSPIVHLFLFEDGQRFTIYSDLDLLEAYLKDLAPEDSAPIEDFIRGCRRSQSAVMPVEKPIQFYNLWDYLKMVKQAPLLPFMRKWTNTSAEEFAGRFQNPLLRSAMRHVMEPVLFEMFVLSEMDLKRSGFPLCGSRDFAGMLAEKYLALGGHIHYRKRVEHIRVEDGCAVGVELDDGSFYPAGTVVSAADGQSTLFKMLGKEYVPEDTRRLYESMKLNTSRVQVALGVSRTFEDLPATVKIIFDTPWEIADGSRYESIDVIIFSHAPAFAPPGKTLLNVQLETTSDAFWGNLRSQDRAAYRAAKTALADELISILDRRLGNIAAYIDMVDVATPASYLRYTGNWRGSIQGWANENIFAANPFKKELPGLERFYMAGQWVEPGGGVPLAYKSGRDLAQIICRRDGRKFGRK